ncbi:MAG: hypothetical protein O3B47_01295 [bacterium]|nr:hypothetical protein [bacterium]
MRKFTIFTVILTIIIVVVVSEIVVNEYLPSTSGDEELVLDLPGSLDLGKSIETSVLGLGNYLGSDVGTQGSFLEAETGAVSSPPVDSNVITQDQLLAEVTAIPDNQLLPVDSPSTHGLPDFEDSSFVSYSANVYLREEQIKNAGFTGAYLESEPHNGLLFKSVDISDLKDVETDKSMVRTADQILAKVYVFRMGVTADINEIYTLVKMRATGGLNIEINETNSYGLASFYLNDSRRNETAFLVVRIGGLIYGFSYPKEYHSQINNLIQLLDWEFS